MDYDEISAIIQASLLIIFQPETEAFSSVSAIEQNSALETRVTSSAGCRENDLRAAMAASGRKYTECLGPNRTRLFYPTPGESAQQLTLTGAIDELPWFEITMDSRNLTAQFSYHENNGTPSADLRRVTIPNCSAEDVRRRLRGAVNPITERFTNGHTCFRRVD